MRGALIHRGRLLSRVKGAKNAQGERELEDVVGPWIRVRVMERSQRSKRRRDDSSDARAEVPFEILVDAIDAETGAPVELTASSVIETDMELLGSPTLQVEGKPEKLNNGRKHIGWVAYATIVRDAS